MFGGVASAWHEKTSRPNAKSGDQVSSCGNLFQRNPAELSLAQKWGPLNLGEAGEQLRSARLLALALHAIAILAIVAFVFFDNDGLEGSGLHLSLIHI